ncbi:MAG: TIGR01841 family phasin [Ottowia sp.]|uniref:TIGR01841 family phasin n=1 Tax=Ottowia sp. TaxID=1898956 RepID=UPI0039E41ADB
MATSKKPTAAGIPGVPSLSDLTKLAEQFKLPGVDVSAFVEWQRKDLEALAEANRRAYEGVQAAAQRRAEMLRETFTQLQGLMADATGKDALARQSDAAQRGVQQAMDNFRELAQMDARTLSDSWQAVQDRLNENMANLQKLLTPKK